jgi:hypothetical protein
MSTKSWKQKRRGNSSLLREANCVYYGLKESNLVMVDCLGITESKLILNLSLIVRSDSGHNTLLCLNQRIQRSQYSFETAWALMVFEELLY